MTAETMIAVLDVEASSAWYQNLLACESNHGGSEFDRLVIGDEVILMLHHWGAPEHPSMHSPSDGVVGNGLVIYFRVDDLDATFQRAMDLDADIVQQPRFNEVSHQREFELKDPDGYYRTVCE